MPLQSMVNASQGFLQGYMSMWQLAQQEKRYNQQHQMQQEERAYQRDYNDRLLNLRTREYEDRRDRDDQLLNLRTREHEAAEEDRKFRREDQLFARNRQSELDQLKLQQGEADRARQSRQDTLTTAKALMDIDTQRTHIAMQQHALGEQQRADLDESLAKEEAFLREVDPVEAERRFGKAKQAVPVASAVVETDYNGRRVFMDKTIGKVIQDLGPATQQGEMTFADAAKSRQIQEQYFKDHVSWLFQDPAKTNSASTLGEVRRVVDDLANEPSLTMQQKEAIQGRIVGQLKYGGHKLQDYTDVAGLPWQLKATEVSAIKQLDPEGYEAAMNFIDNRPKSGNPFLDNIIAERFATRLVSDVREAIRLDIPLNVLKDPNAKRGIEETRRFQAEEKLKTEAALAAEQKAAAAAARKERNARIKQRAYTGGSLQGLMAGSAFMPKQKSSGIRIFPRN